MVDFTQQISNFTRYGTYNYTFDSVGNVILNPSSSQFTQVYFSLPMRTPLYNEAKILAFNDPTFTEFVPQSTASVSSSVFSQDAIDQINSITAENLSLQSQLDAIMAASTQNSASAYQQSIRDTILTLRMQLGQGRSASDFSTEYPYMPIPLEHT